MTGKQHTKDTVNFGNQSYFCGKRKVTGERKREDRKGNENQTLKPDTANQLNGLNSSRLALEGWKATTQGPEA